MQTQDSMFTVDQNDLSCKDEATGISYDFNYGLQLRTPVMAGAMWHVQVFNADTGSIIHAGTMPPNSYWHSPYLYYIRYRFEAFNTSNGATFVHEMDLEGKEVHVMMTHSTLGDCTAYLSQVPYFAEKTGALVSVFVQPWCLELYGDSFKKATKNVTLKTLDKRQESKPYATYRLGLIFDLDQSAYWQKEPFQYTGLQFQAAKILGLSTTQEPDPPPLFVPQERKIKEPYVCIAFSGSKLCKFWHNVYGWDTVIRHLKDRGYRVFCIDQAKVLGLPGAMMYRPEGCEDVIGDIPLTERAELIHHADMFIGMASGLSWLAWACGVPVVMISGFSRPAAEFYTPYRVYNEESPCKDCWGDVTIKFERHDWSWCPRVDAKLDNLKAKIKAEQEPSARYTLQAEYEQVASMKFICTQSIAGSHVVKMVDAVIKDCEYDRNQRLKGVTE